MLFDLDNQSESKTAQFCLRLNPLCFTCTGEDANTSSSISSKTDPFLWASACVLSKQLLDILILALQLVVVCVWFF